MSILLSHLSLIMSLMSLVFPRAPLIPAASPPSHGKQQPPHDSIPLPAIAARFALSTAPSQLTRLTPIPQWLACLPAPPRFCRQLWLVCASHRPYPWALPRS
jgi:hypothetical protein